MAEHEPRPEAMSAEEIAALHRWKNEEVPRVMPRGSTEMMLCKLLDRPSRSA